MPELNFNFLRSTPERRAAVFEIKLMFDEAHRLAEDGNLDAYARQIAQIELQMAIIDPTSNKKDACKGAAIIQVCGAEAGRAWLDERLNSLGELLGHFEDRLRIGYGLEMTGGLGVELGLVKFI